MGELHISILQWYMLMFQWTHPTMSKAGLK